MNEFLAQIFLTLCAPEDPEFCVRVSHYEVIGRSMPIECRVHGDAARAKAEAMGYLADYQCDYTAAPARSMRPRARPVEA